MNIHYNKSTAVTTLHEKYNIIGFTTTSTNSNWHGTDSENYFLSKIDTDDNIQDKTISYKFNDVGHRSNLDFKDLNQYKDYIVVTGCSHSMGVGVCYDLIYWNKLNLKYPIYNLSISGSGNDLITKNLLSLLVNNYSNLPKLIICQWTSDDRFTLWRTSHRVGHWFMNKTVKEFLIEGCNINYWEQLHSELRKQLLSIINLFKIPYIEFGFNWETNKNCIEKSYKMFNIPILDKARDDVHVSNITHSYISNLITQEFSTTLKSFIL